MHCRRRAVNWRELHDVALEAHDPKALKHEEHVRHDSSETMRANKSFNWWLDCLFVSFGFLFLQPRSDISASGICDISRVFLNQNASVFWNKS
jgi:hypothetical protein